MDLIPIVLIGTAAFLVAGTIKGVAGIGLPTASIALMTLILDPRTAIALVMFPMVGSNLWQLLRSGQIQRTAKRYWLFALILFAGVAATALSTQNASDRVLLAFLGAAVLIFVVASWKKLLPSLPDRYDRAAQVGFGLAAGVIGGMTAAWASPLAVYLTARGVDKDEFIRATGFLICIGSLPLVAAYAHMGFLTGPLASVSLVMLIPTLIGFSVGEALRQRMSVETFRQVMLVVFLILGLNLIRRAIWYA